MFRGVFRGARFALLRFMKSVKFAIRNAGKQSEAIEGGIYDSLEEARGALRELLGWTEVQLGPGYTTPSTDSQIWCAYRTRTEAEADPDGLSTPRIVRLSPDPEAEAARAS